MALQVVLPRNAASQRCLGGRRWISPTPLRQGSPWGSHLIVGRYGGLVSSPTEPATPVDGSDHPFELPRLQRPGRPPEAIGTAGPMPTRYPLAGAEVSM